MKEECGECKYHVDGGCRKRAPHYSESAAYGRYRLFPDMRSYEWCGEFERKEVDDVANTAKYCSTCEHYCSGDPSQANYCRIESMIQPKDKDFCSKWEGKL